MTFEFDIGMIQGKLTTVYQHGTLEKGDSELANQRWLVVGYLLVDHV